MAPYPYFDPVYNMVPDPNPNYGEPDGPLVPGELYVSKLSGESGLLGLAFHPDFANNGKLYVSLTALNPNRPYIPASTGIDPTGSPMLTGISSAEVAMLNQTGSAARNAFLTCFVCDEIANKPEALVGFQDLYPPPNGDGTNDDVNGNGTADAGWRVVCNGLTYKAHAVTPSVTQIREYTVDRNGSSNPGDWSLDSSNYRTVLQFERRFDFHNGGWIGFGPDGMLYYASGDSQGTPGEGAVQPLSHPEDPAADFFGKILRLDVSDMSLNNGPLDDGTIRNYTIPSNNPFAPGGVKATATPADDEVYAYGMRNPWRVSFDSVAGDMWIGDVGFNSAEEVNVIPAGSGGGQNFGWPYYEGDPTQGGAEFLPGAVGRPAFQDTDQPEYWYPTTGDNRGAIIGGFVYRGPDPTLQGKYIYYESDRRQLFSYDPNKPDLPPVDISNKVFDDFVHNDTLQNGPDGKADTNWWGTGVPTISTGKNNNVRPVGLLTSLDQDSEGNLYLVSLADGDIFRLNTQTYRKGDFNGDGTINAIDIDMLADAAINGGSLALYDLNGDNKIDFVPNASDYHGDSDELYLSDSDDLIRHLVDLNSNPAGPHGTEYGDLDLDREVFLGDLDMFATNWRKAGQFGWANGNIDGSHEAGTVNDPQIFLGDLDIFARFWRFGVNGGASLQAVPEPGGWLLSIVGVLAWFCGKRRH